MAAIRTGKLVGKRLREKSLVSDQEPLAEPTGRDRDLENLRRFTITNANVARTSTTRLR